MGFIIEQECPQCGAPIELSETDRILSCPYCDVQSYLFSNGYFRYLLPHNAPEREITYIPYLRFKGSVFFCGEVSIGYRLIDITRTGVKLNSIPISLGLRPQAMKARFATGETRGKFMKFSLKAIEILTRAAKLTETSEKEEIYHTAFIGETMSIMYLPVYVEGEKLYDAILNRPIGSLKEEDEAIESRLIREINESVSFIPTICPKCGWTMKGERDGVVLLCNNCVTAWEVKDKKYSNIKMIISGKPDKDTVYLPFWKITAKTKGIDIKTFSDFVHITNQPLITGEEKGSRPMNYWSPAFKIRPKMFLQLARQFTVMQENEFYEMDSMPEKGMFPVTLPLSEAIQALKMILASSTVMRKNVIPFLPRIRFIIEEKALIYLPFRQTRYDMINDELGVSVNRQSLEFGRTL
jgi:ssDNA-binding Zn-finger/Zn-ribbon topoisomerase 1